MEREKGYRATWIGVTRPALGTSDIEARLSRQLSDGMKSIRPQDHANCVWWGDLDRFRNWDDRETKTLLALAEGEEPQAHISRLLAAAAAIVDGVLAESVLAASRSIGDIPKPDAQD